MNKPSIYRIFLLTIWNETSENGTEAPLWRFRLEDPHTGEYALFTDQQSLTEHLMRWTVGMAGDDEARP